MDTQPSKTHNETKFRLCFSNSFFGQQRDIVKLFFAKRKNDKWEDYAKLLKKIAQKNPEKVEIGILIFCDNANHNFQKFLQSQGTGLESLNSTTRRSSYSPILVPSYSYLFPKLKKRFATKAFTSSENVKKKEKKNTFEEKNHNSTKN
jgi:hypothetical protein